MYNASSKIQARRMWIQRMRHKYAQRKFAGVKMTVESKERKQSKTTWSNQEVGDPDSPCQHQSIPV